MKKVIFGVILCIYILTGCSYREVPEPEVEVVEAEEATVETKEVIVVPQIPEVQSLDDIPEVILENEDEDLNIDVSAQISYISTVEKQVAERIKWINQYAHTDVSGLNAILAEAENLRTYYAALSAYTYADIRMLAVAVAYEAGYCTAEHQEYVAQVVLNRCADPRFNDDIYGNLTRPGQYNPIYVQKKQADYWKNKDINEWNRCVKAAMRAMMGLVDMPENVIFQSEFSKLGTGVWKEIKVDLSGYKSTTYFNYG